VRAMKRLPVAPRPFRDELLSSWLARVACRYGLEMRDLIGYWGDERWVEAIDVDGPTTHQAKIWAQACGMDPVRLQHLSLTRRRPKRLNQWFLDRASQRVPVCLACLDTDFAAGRDGYVRADWMLAELCACPKHRQMLLDRCPSCEGRLQISFRMREDHARLTCGKCGYVLTGRGGEVASGPDTDFVERVVELQKKIGRIVTESTEPRERLETLIATLWAPLDHPAAARPVLALWFDQPGWCCPFQVRHAVGLSAPLSQLPLRWRALTLVALRDLFGSELRADVALGENARQLLRRAAPHRKPRSIRRVIQKTPDADRRVPVDYAVLAEELLADPDWVGAESLTERRCRTVRASLIDKILARDGDSYKGVL